MFENIYFFYIYIFKMQKMYELKRMQFAYYIIYINVIFIYSLLFSSSK